MDRLARATTSLIAGAAVAPQFFKDAYYRGTVKRQLKGTGVANLNTIGFNDQALSACFEHNCY